MPTLWLSDTQKIGVAFCTGGAAFLLLGVFLFFDRAMLAMGNILFLIGLPLTTSISSTISFFFARESPQKKRGTASFLLGISLILFFRWRLLVILGFFVEMFGIVILFGDFFVTAAGFVRGVPVIGPVLGKGLTWLGRGAGMMGGGAAGGGAGAAGGMSGEV